MSSSINLENLPGHLDGQQIQSILEEADRNPQNKHITGKPSLLRRVKALKSAIETNSLLRSEYADEPSKFLASEVDLDEEIRCFKALGAHPDLLTDFSEAGGTQLMAGLLVHQNSDIALAALDVFVDLTDPELLQEGGSKQEQLRSFVTSLLDEFDFFALIGDNLDRLKEDESDEDFQGVTNLLQCIDHLLDAEPDETIKQLLENRRVLKWLVNRISAEKDAAVVDYNRLYCVELLATILPISLEAQRVLPQSVPQGLNMLEDLLIALSRYRKMKKFPTLEDQEFVLNVKNCIVSCLLLPANREIFADLEGVSLMLRLLKEKGQTEHAALEILSLALINTPRSCAEFVQRGGLGLIFPLLMAVTPSSWMLNQKLAKFRRAEMVLLIVLHLVTNCVGTEQTRVMTKFFENGCEKLKTLVRLHAALWTHCVQVTEEFRSEIGWECPFDYNKEVDEAFYDAPIADEEAEVYLERSEMGLLPLQLIDRILMRLSRQGQSVLTIQIHVLLDPSLQSDSTDGGVASKLIDTVAYVLREYVHHLDAEEHKEEREVLRKAIKTFVREHEHMLALGQSYEADAEQKGKEVKAQMDESKAEEEVELRAKKRKTERFREKLAKMDRALERQEELEQFRYDRKHGTL